MKSTDKIIQKRDYYIYVIMKCGLTREMAEDITQEAYLACLNKGITDEGWFRRCIRNSVADYYRTRNQNCDLDTVAEFLLAKPSNEEHLLRKITLKKAMKKVKKNKQEVIKMRMEGDDFQQIAERLQIPLHVALYRSASAMSQLKELVKK